MLCYPEPYTMGAREPALRHTVQGFLWPLKLPSKPSMTTPTKLIEGVDFYMEGGLMVLSQGFLLRRGYCCNKGCRHCPYGESASIEVKPNVTIVGSTPDCKSS